MTGSRPALSPIAAATVEPQWEGAEWVGTIDVRVLRDALLDGIPLVGGERYRRARLLVRQGTDPLGFVSVPVREGVARPAAAAVAIESLIAAAQAQSLCQEGPEPADLPPITIVLCTRDRPDHLAGSLASLRRLDYPDFDVLVVDNAPVRHPAADVVAQVGDLPVPLRVVSAPVPGLARARNVGLTEAGRDIVAFTDDDVVVEPGWLRGLARGFSRGEDVVCVSGLVPGCELNTPAQAYFEHRVGWSDSCSPRLYALDRPPENDPVYPFRVGRFGTGANFALRRGAAVALGGFDEGLGVGSPTGGGEDMDMFLRVLLSGGCLAVEPSAVVWHRHRTEPEELTRQMRDYGMGLGAWITKLMLVPRTRRMVLRRLLPGIRHGMTVTRPRGSVPQMGTHMAWSERRALLAGAAALRRARRAGASATPLHDMITADRTAKEALR